MTPALGVSVRTLHADAEFGGYVIPVDTEVVAMLAAANRDPEHFDDPERFDVARYGPGRNTPPHLSFGGGGHYCLGAALATLEIETALATLLRRFPGMRVDLGGAGYERVPVRLPRPWFGVWREDGSAYAMLMEDLVVGGCRFPDLMAGPSLEFAERVMDALHQRGVPRTAIIGRLIQPPDYTVTYVSLCERCVTLWLVRR